MPCSETQTQVKGLQADLAREVKFAPSLSHLLASDEDYVTASQRDQSLLHLLKLSLHFGFEPETFALAVNYTDRFLGKVKVHPKYLQCISLASLYLASKISEEEEYVPTASDFVAVSRAPCTASDLLRMERLIVQKLDWDLLLPSPIMFLQKFSDLMEVLGYISHEFAITVVQHILPKMLKLLCQNSFTEHKGSTLALAILQYEIGSLSPSLSNALEEIIKILKIDYGSFIHCHGLIQDFMDMQVTMHHKNIHPRKRRKSSRSNSLHILPTIYESMNDPDFEMSENNNDVFEDHNSDKEDHFGEKDINCNNNRNEFWLDNKHEFPDIFDTLPTPRRTAHKNAKKLYNYSSSDNSPDKPLYSTIVKTSSNGISYLYDNPSYQFYHESISF